MRALVGCAAVAAISFHSFEAAACGCFAAPVVTTTDPIVQAGERILFAQTGNQVTAYVQIQFKGDASDFGWLLPLPAVPDVKTGTDELFEVLDATTRPRFALTTTLNGACQPSRGVSFGCGSGAYLAGGRGEGQDAGVGPSPLVLQNTAGPYHYAVLKADSKAELLQWLSDNRYSVPVTSDEALKPYIRPGGYFLALKLRSGQTAGDLKPVVLTYTSDYPMIPLILTSATAVPNMGVQVFVLGEHRAVPRNFHHVELNLLKLEWSDAKNYAALVTQAVAEAPEKHAFVTEYAGSSQIARGQLTAAGRFGSRVVLENLSGARGFVDYLYEHGFTLRGTNDLSDGLMNVLATAIPVPASAPSRQEYYRSGDLTGVTIDPKKLSDDVWAAVAQPIIDADRLLDSKPTLTRMFTTLSPEDMTKDPVFGFNPSLPDVSNVHGATRVTGCQNVPTTFATERYSLPDESRLTETKRSEMPAAARVEQLPEEGAPVGVSEYMLDNALVATVGSKCAIADGAFMAALAAAWLILRRRKFEGR